MRGVDWQGAIIVSLTQTKLTPQNNLSGLDSHATWLVAALKVAIIRCQSIYFSQGWYINSPCTVSSCHWAQVYSVGWFGSFSFPANIGSIVTRKLWLQTRKRISITESLSSRKLCSARISIKSKSKSHGHRQFNTIELSRILSGTFKPTAYIIRFPGWCSATLNISKSTFLEMLLKLFMQDPEL